jgi:hypothetical protein
MTGQLADLNQHQGDGIAMKKDLGIDEGSFGGLLTIGAAWGWGDPPYPTRIDLSFMGWGAHGHKVLPRGSWYGPGFLPAGEPTSTDLYITRTALDGSVCVAGHGDPTWGGWSLDLVAGVHLWQVQWAITTQNQGTHNARLTDARIFAGVEAHYAPGEHLTLHLRAVAGNPSILGGLGAGLEWRSGPWHVWGRLHLGTPVSAQAEAGVRVAVGWGLELGVFWRELLDQVEDGGSFQGKQNEGMTRVNHAFFGLLLSGTF